MPVFNLDLPRAVKALLAKFPPETLLPGDVLVTNDPWLCAGHLFDIAVVTPVFRDGALVGADRHGRPCRRHRRHQGFAAGARDLRGGHPDPADEAVPRRRAERGPVHADRRERAQARRRCSATSTPSSPPTRSAPSGCWRSWTNTACTICDALAAVRAGPLREGDARGDPRAAGRRLHVGGLEQSARRRRCAIR